MNVLIFETIMTAWKDKEEDGGAGPDYMTRNRSSLQSDGGTLSSRAVNALPHLHTGEGELTANLMALFCEA